MERPTYFLTTQDNRVYTGRAGDEFVSEPGAAPSANAFFFQNFAAACRKRDGFNIFSDLHGYVFRVEEANYN